MEPNGIDTWLRRLSAGVPRRHALAGIAAGALGLGLGAQDGRGKKKHKHHHQHQASGQPKLATAYSCAGNPDYSVGSSGDFPIGQIFTATRSGTLRQIRVSVIKEVLGAGGDYLVQLLRTTGDPARPGARVVDVLAAAVIPDGDVPLGTSTVVAEFAATHLVQGAVYAVMVSRPGAALVSVQVQPTDVCAGELTLDQTLDMIVSVMVA